jgi:5-methylcytosine-specific restriction endonuclease McrA
MNLYIIRNQEKREQYIAQNANTKEFEKGVGKDMRIKRDKADELFSKLIRNSYPICQACGMRRASQVHHFKGRRYQAVRFSKENIWSVCFPCHRRFHEDPEWGREKMIKRLGVNGYDDFNKMANYICKRNKLDKKILAITFKKELESLISLPKD